MLHLNLLQNFGVNRFQSTVRFSQSDLLLTSSDGTVAFCKDKERILIQWFSRQVIQFSCQTLGDCLCTPDALHNSNSIRSRKRGGDPRDARAYIRPLGNAHCPTPATQKRRRPKGRQGVHPTPWQCTLSHACHAKEAENQGTPGRTSDPLAMHIGPRLPGKRGGDPRDAWAYIRPLGNAHFFPCLPRKRGGDPRDARACIRPLGNAHCPTPATQKRRRPKGRQGVHPTPWQCTLSHACHAKEAETQGTPGRTSDPLAMHIVPRLPRKRGGDPRDARAYIRPLGKAHCPTPATQKRRRPKGRQGIHPTPWQCTLSHACHAKEAETQGTPGRTSDPLAMHIFSMFATQKRRRPKGRQGVHPTPWQCTLSHACHAKETETQGTPGRTSDPLAVHIVPRLPRKSDGDQPQGVHPTPRVSVRVSVRLSVCVCV